MMARTLERLKEYKLAERSKRDGWVLTPKGKEEAKDIR
jgi:Mn-dependent DtxR family transcriptional regulator